MSINLRVHRGIVRLDQTVVTDLIVDRCLPHWGETLFGLGCHHFESISYMVTPEGFVIVRTKGAVRAAGNF